MTMVTGDDWNGSVSGHWEIEEPTAAAVHDAVRGLDGANKTALTVSRDDPFQQLTVAGGPECFVVTGELPDQSIIELRNPRAGGGRLELVCGGQRGWFDRSQVVDLDQALHAVDAFLAGFPGRLGDDWVVQA